MNYPAPHTFELLPYQPVGKDSRGNVRDAWGDPVTLPAIAFVWPASNEPHNEKRDTVVIRLQLYLHNTHAVGARDKVTVLGKTYDVQGEPEDYNFGPWWHPGAVVVNAERVEG